MTCGCEVVDREEEESEREWFKRWMCMFHWMQTDYYRDKLLPPKQEHQWEFYANGSFCKLCGAQIGSGVECR